MATIIVDYRELLKFAGNLDVTVDELRKQLLATERALDIVSEKWKDSQFVKFNQRFEEDKYKLDKLCVRIKEFEGVIQRLAKKVEIYNPN